VKNTCSVDECAKPSYCQRMCTTHYQRVRNHGSVEDPTLTRADRFWRNVQVDENGHWIWIGALNAGGYGVAAGGLAHRVSWEMHRQPIPAGLHIDHVCRVTACVNPAHLDVVTAHENADRGYARNVNASRQLSKTHCLRGHEYTAENTRYSPAGTRSCRSCARLRRVDPEKYLSTRSQGWRLALAETTGHTP
jgi:hypothetical protein